MQCTVTYGCIYTDISLFSFSSAIAIQHIHGALEEYHLIIPIDSLLDMDRLNLIINDLIVSNEFNLILPVVKAGLSTLVRDNYLAEFLTSVEQLSVQQKTTYHHAFVHLNKQLIDIETYLQGLSQTLDTQYSLKLFNINEFLSQLPYNAVRQQLLHTTHIIKSTFYTKFIDIFEYYLAAYASQHARLACAELTKGGSTASWIAVIIALHTFRCHILLVLSVVTVRGVSMSRVARTI